MKQNSFKVVTGIMNTYPPSSSSFTFSTTSCYSTVLAMVLATLKCWFSLAQSMDQENRSQISTHNKSTFQCSEIFNVVTFLSILEVGYYPLGITSIVPQCRAGINQNVHVQNAPRLLVKYCALLAPTLIEYYLIIT